MPIALFKALLIGAGIGIGPAAAIAFGPLGVLAALVAAKTAAGVAVSNNDSATSKRTKSSPRPATR